MRVDECNDGTLGYWWSSGRARWILIIDGGLFCRQVPTVAILCGSDAWLDGQLLLSSGCAVGTCSGSRGRLSFGGGVAQL